MRRREALIAMVAPLLVGFHAADAQFRPLPAGPLAEIVDLILPADAMSPSASDLGVHTEIQNTIAGHPLLRRLFEYGLTWIDQVGGRPFLELPREAQLQILNFAEQADFNQVPGRFFAVLRVLACELYFSQTEAIAGYPLNDAPQPDGYLPPWE